MIKYAFANKDGNTSIEVYNDYLKINLESDIYSDVFYLNLECIRHVCLRRAEAANEESAINFSMTEDGDYNFNILSCDLPKLEQLVNRIHHQIFLVRHGRGISDASKNDKLKDARVKAHIQTMKDNQKL